MLKIKITSQYKKDHKKAQKQGKNLDELKLVISKIAKKGTLPQHYKDHALSGKLRDQRDCHIESDFILLYKIKDDELLLVRLGSHSELFK